MKPLLLALFLCTCAPALLSGQRAAELIEQVANAVGLEAMQTLKDVEYSYHAGNTESLERYIFDGEVSYGRTRTDDGRTVEQYHNGRTTTVIVDGQLTREPAEVSQALFRRKTNYYWLMMMHKLRDPGVEHDYIGTRVIEGIPYELVDMTFGEGVGLAQDRYRLFVNPYTYLVDRFLYTVAAADRLTPTLMQVTYDCFPEGVRLPVVSRSHPVRDWEGEPTTEGEWRVSHRKGFRFNNGFTPETIRQ
ncbi:hypothetical protein GGR26_001764 [Lewinella marina]|uniref:Outer membrane lipoprotein-sorting protein n=1 Tax=Neolewinella marina TaxID=438751 RepID=A0A2G0CDH9_9BACT|nr:DUF6503 family protein [Neolewinella marina]NJB85996.1 hypothetical protein [Neolewinella marina]PHK98036.1 hypothetical protein CGL56_12660 [Neolewinella marina]